MKICRVIDKGELCVCEYDALSADFNYIHCEPNEYSDLPLYKKEELPVCYDCDMECTKCPSSYLRDDGSFMDDDTITPCWEREVEEMWNAHDKLKKLGIQYMYSIKETEQDMVPCENPIIVLKFIIRGKDDEKTWNFMKLYGKCYTDCSEFFEEAEEKGFHVDEYDLILRKELESIPSPFTPIVLSERYANYEEDMLRLGVKVDMEEVRLMDGDIATTFTGNIETLNKGDFYVSAVDVIMPNGVIERVTLEDFIKLAKEYGVTNVKVNDETISTFDDCAIKYVLEFPSNDMEKFLKLHYQTYGPVFGLICMYDDFMTSYLERANVSIRR